MGNFSRIAKPLKILPRLKFDHLISSLHPNETDKQTEQGRRVLPQTPLYNPSDG